MRAYTRGDRCLMQLLQESLDDPSAAPCGRCSVCLGRLPEPLSARPEDDTVAAVTRTLRGEVHVLEPRKMWPGGAFGARGRIPAELMAEPGRTVIYADAPEWRELVRTALAQDGPAPEELCRAAVEVLAGWRASWVSRPEVVLPLAAAGLDRVTREVADHLARVGRLDRADLPLATAAPDPALSSPEEAAGWRSAIVVGDDLAAQVRGRTVLLVCDASSSLWPLTVGAAALREAGAAAVLPLLLHRRP